MGGRRLKGQFFKICTLTLVFAISDGQARVLLATPPAATLKGPRDRAILATFLFHGLRLDELLKLRPKDMHQHRTLSDLKSRLERFAEDFGDRTVRSINHAANAYRNFWNPTKTSWICMGAPS